MLALFIPLLRTTELFVRGLFFTEIGVEKAEINDKGSGCSLAKAERETGDETAPGARRYSKPSSILAKQWTRLANELDDAYALLKALNELDLEEAGELPMVTCHPLRRRRPVNKRRAFAYRDASSTGKLYGPGGGSDGAARSRWPGSPVGPGGPGSPFSPRSPGSPLRQVHPFHL